MQTSRKHLLFATTATEQVAILTFCFNLTRFKNGGLNRDRLSVFSGRATDYLRKQEKRIPIKKEFLTKREKTFRLEMAKTEKAVVNRLYESQKHKFIRQDEKLGQAKLPHLRHVC